MSTLNRSSLPRAIPHSLNTLISPKPTLPSNPLTLPQPPLRLPPTFRPALNSPPLHRLSQPPPNLLPQQEQHNYNNNWSRDSPKASFADVQTTKIVNVHAKVTGDEGHGQEKDGDDGELLHAFVLVGADCVED